MNENQNVPQPPDNMLKSELKRPLEKMQLGREKSAMRQLIGMLNNPEITGAFVPAGENPMEALDAEAPTELVTEETPQTIKQVPPPVAFDVTSKIFFTGRLYSGKDHAASAIGATILGVADPLYYLANHFFGTQVTATSGKDIPGIRAFLQAAGQWGRAHVDEQYPLTPARACFVTMVRSLAAAGVISGHEVEWDKFGSEAGLWLDAVLRRADVMLALGEATRLAVTNVRFKLEFDTFRDAGWTHFHVMCSPQTWMKRLANSKLTPQSPQVNDVSEKMAAALNDQVIKQISQNKNGHRLHVIWNDDEVAPPSNRLLTLMQFCQQVDSATAPVEISSGE
jgi:hypothetical protein